MGKKLLGFFMAVLVAVSNIQFSFAASTNISTEEQLRNELQTGGDKELILENNLNINEKIVLGNGNITIDLRGNKLTLGQNVENMFMASGSGVNVTIKNGELNGDNKGRLFFATHGANLTFDSVVVQNGSTNSFQEKINKDSGKNEQQYQGGAIYIDGGVLNLTGTTFEGNSTKKDTPNKDDVAPHGGAIYAGSRATINVVRGQFKNNVTGNVVGNKGNNGEGGAIKLEGGSILNINKETDTQKDLTIFEGNHNSGMGGGGNQGGAIEVTESTVNIYGTTFKVAAPFDTGGAIKFEGGTGTIKNSDFIIDNLGDGYGVSGGAIISENSNLLIEKSDFTATGTSKVTYAGGLIDVVGTGNFTLKDSKMTGTGSWWNGPATATYGGAIAFETGSSVTALIENTTIKDIAADENGGAISISTKKGETSSVKLTVRNSTIQNTRTRIAWKKTFGGGIYNGPGNTLTIEGGTLTESFSVLGGSIYNEGSATITGGANIVGNTTYVVGGGIYNNGVLTVDNATLNNNRNAENKNFPDKDPAEMIGSNIYAKKDVTITPNAVFDDYDVRVLDKESAILLTGELKNQINVSISEKSREKADTYQELPHRYVGYTVAKGTSGYTPVPTDAQFIHYVTKDTTQLSSDVADHTGTGLWDYVFNPEAKTVVLGQRAKLVYHTNESTATITDGVKDDAPAGQKLDQVYTFYHSKDGEMPKVSIDNKTVTELTTTDKIPALKGYTFKSWNTDKAKEKPKYDVSKTEDVYNFTGLTFTNTWHKPATSEIKDILHFESRNTLDTYAVYNKDEKESLKVNKVWNGIKSDDAPAVTVELWKGTVNTKETKVLSKDNEWKDEFTGLEGKATEYTVKEQGETNGKVMIGNDRYTVEYAGGTITNTKDDLPKTTLTVIKEWSGIALEEAKEVTVELWKNGAKSAEKVLNENNKWTDKFDNLLLKDTFDGADNQYEVKEKDAVTGNDGAVTWTKDGKTFNVTVKRANDTVTVTNTLKEDPKPPTPDPQPPTPETIDLTVKKVWVVKKVTTPAGDSNTGRSATEEATAVTGVVSATDNTVGATPVEGAPATETTTENNAVPVVENTTSTVAENTNAATVTETTTTLPKSITVQLYRNGVLQEGKTLTLKASANEDENWKAKFIGLEGKATEYTVEEVGEKEKKVTIDGNVYAVSYQYTNGEAIITNTQEDEKPPVDPTEPEKVSLTVTKEWGTTPEADQKEIKVELLKNGEVTGTEVSLKKDNGWKDTVVLKAGENIKEYTVREVGEKDTKVTIGGKEFVVSYDYDYPSGKATITNKLVPTEDKPGGGSTDKEDKPKKDDPKPTPPKEPETPATPEEPKKPEIPNIEEESKIIEETPTKETTPTKEKEKKPTTKKPTIKKSVPKTGDRSNMLQYYSLVLVSLSGLLLTNKRKKKSSDN